MKKTIGILCILSIVLSLAIITASAATSEKTISPTKIEIKSTEKGGYLLYVDGEVLLLKGVGYSPTPIGKGHDYDFFSDPNKPWLIDGKLMKEAGINCVRIYSPGKDLEKVKEFISDMYENFGIYTLM
ncbi:MAG: hypothetical protein KAS05_03035, partial [Candidatus Omnitrophica bacterium]|nr:hypothetical protein [Candidatus Omnitrophota bacterium]